MSKKAYRGQDLDVMFDLKRCIHAAECGKRLQAVFDVKKRPWVQPDNAAANEVAATIEQCPSGALTYSRHDGGAEEAVSTNNTILIMDSGEYRIRGNVALTTMTGESLASEHRLTLCRCGESKNKPFCDNSHREAGFAAPSSVVDNVAETADLQPTGSFKIMPATNGPLLLQGNFEIHDQSGQHIFRGTKAALCRCGNSASKPFCDGTHKAIGFEAP
ncbi:MAG: CDGSH iron-sulfur domain-containing protein [Chloroflexota bacterium]